MDTSRTSWTASDIDLTCGGDFRYSPSEISFDVEWSPQSESLLWRNLGLPPRDEVLAEDKSAVDPFVTAKRCSESSAPPTLTKSVRDLIANVAHDSPFGNSGRLFRFDWSCFDRLDEQLIAAPMDAFTALCWSEAVGEDPTAQSVHRESRCSLTLVSDADSPPSLSMPQETTTSDTLTASTSPSSVSLPRSEDVDCDYPSQSVRQLQVDIAPTKSRYDDLPFPIFSIPKPNDSIHFFPQSPLRGPRRVPRGHTLLRDPTQHTESRLSRIASLMSWRRKTGLHVVAHP